MSRKDPFKHTFNVLTKMEGDTLLELDSIVEFEGLFKALQARLKESYKQCRKPEKLYLYMLATNDMETINKMAGGGDAETAE